MELKINIGDETEVKKPDTTSEDDFPLNTSWTKEASTHLSKAYDIVSKGDGELAMEAADMIQSVLDILSPVTESEEVEEMKSTKKDYMDKFIDKDDEEKNA